MKSLDLSFALDNRLHQYWRHCADRPCMCDLFRLKDMQMMIMAMAHVGGLLQNAHQACPAASLTG